MGQNRVPATGQNGLRLNVTNQTYSVQSSVWEQGGPSTSLPWVIGGRPDSGWQFGLLFNSPTLGGVVFNETNMTWQLAQDTGGIQNVRQQLDFLVTTHSADAKPADKAFQVMNQYVDAVGHAPKMPYPGYWHSKNRVSASHLLLQRRSARGPRVL